MPRRRHAPRGGAAAISVGCASSVPPVCAICSPAPSAGRYHHTVIGVFFYPIVIVMDIGISRLHPTALVLAPRPTRRHVGCSPRILTTRSEIQQLAFDWRWSRGTSEHRAAGNTTMSGLAASAGADELRRV